MNMIALSLYFFINILMVGICLFRGKGQIYEFPFWAGVIALGWFCPQAFGGYLNVEQFPDYAYADGLFFASACTVAMWLGFGLSYKRKTQAASWLDVKFDLNKLYWASAAFCLFGFYFQWKLLSLPKEMLAMTQWTGATVKYLFLSSVFRFGFITLWLIYLSQPKRYVPRLLIFMVPCFALLFKVAVLDGRREGMMDLLAYVVLGLWFGRRKTIPRWLMVVGLVFGLLFINAIGTYRAIMLHGDKSITERMSDAVNADYVSTSKEMLNESGAEFRNFIFYRYIYEESGEYDYGLIHWNNLIFNYVPAQIVGREIKDALMIPLINVNELGKRDYGFSYMRGTTSTGYRDAFGSFGWFGCVKFLLIGLLMGILYRHAMQGSLLGQLLYIYMLGSAMLAVTHTTHRILFSGWVYFFALAYPAFYWAKDRRALHRNSFADDVIDKDNVESINSGKPDLSIFN